MPTTQKRPKDEASTSAPAADDYFLVDGSTNGVRALAASYFPTNFAPIPNLDREIRLDEPVAYWPMTDVSASVSEQIIGTYPLVPSGALGFQGGTLGSGTAPTTLWDREMYGATTGNPLGTDFFRHDWSAEIVVSAVGGTLFGMPAPSDLVLIRVGRAVNEVTVEPDEFAQFQLEIQEGDTSGGYLAIRSGENLALLKTFDVRIPILETFHLAVTYTTFTTDPWTGGFRVYVNGRAITAGPFWPGDANLPTGGANALIRTMEGITTPTGRADAVLQGYLAFYNKVLTPTRIMAHAVNLARA